jgi:probable addiction module antidote protein
MPKKQAKKSTYSKFDIAKLLQLAREVGISREGLYTALSGEGNPSFATVVKVAKAMGLRLAFQQS